MKMTAQGPRAARLRQRKLELSRGFPIPPDLCFRDGSDRVEIWDTDDFDSWEALTNLPRHRISRRSLYAMAKSRWQIENQGFNDAKNRHGLEPSCDHHPHSLLLVWLLTCLALTLERLYRLRYLHHGTPPARAAIERLRLLLLTLSQPAFADFS